MIKQFLFFGLFLISLSIEGFPQRYVWENYTNTSQITFLMKDGNYFWIGTSGGLIKLNTANNEKILYNKTTPGFPGNYITSVKKTSDGNIWIGTKNGGLGKFDGQIWSSINADNSSLPIDCITALAPGNNLDLWAATWGGGLIKINNNNLIVYNTFNSIIPNDFIRYIIFDNGSGSVLMGAFNSDLFWFDGYNGAPMPYDPYYFDLSSLIINNSDWLWITNNNYLSGYYMPNQNIEELLQLPVPSSINTISVDSLNHIWLGTQGNGIFIWEDSNWVIYNTDNSGLPGNDVRAILADGQTEWIGTFDGGLVKFDGTNWQPVNTNTSAPFQSSVNSFFFDHNNKGWIGFEEDGIWNFHNGQWTNLNAGNSGLSNNYVMSTAEDNSGNYWIGTYYGGLNKFDGINWKNYNPENSSLPDSNIVSVQKDSEGNIWIATWGGGLCRFDGINWTIYNSSNSGLSDDYIFSMYIDNSDNIWIGTFGSGLFEFNGTDWQVFNTGNSAIPSDFISDVKSDNHNNIWIATWSDGLAEYNNVSFTTFNSSNTSFPIDFVNCLAPDDLGNVYIGTRNSGLVKFSANNNSGELFDSYNSGMIENEVTALGIDNDGNIWIGFNEGIAVLNPDSVLSVDNRTTSEIPFDFMLYQNYPNPFNPVTTIDYSLPQNSMVILKVYNILGQELTSLVREEQRAGKHSAKFDGSKLPSGVYIYKLTAGKFSASKKLVLLK